MRTTKISVTKRNNRSKYFVSQQQGYDRTEVIFNDCILKYKWAMTGENLSLKTLSFAASQTHSHWSVTMCLGNDKADHQPAYPHSLISTLSRVNLLAIEGLYLCAACQVNTEIVVCWWCLLQFSYFTTYLFQKNVACKQYGPRSDYTKSNLALQIIKANDKAGELIGE